MKLCLSERKCYNKQKNDGYILLFSVLLIGIVASTIVVSSLVVGMDNHRTGFTKLNSAQARNLATACGEEALQRISDEQNFDGTDTSQINNGDCQYTVYDLGGQNRMIEAIGFKNGNTKRVLIEIESTNLDTPTSPEDTPITPSMNIASWQEVSEFNW